jgi:tetratricopeptide (TPR) repeat protein
MTRQRDELLPALDSEPGPMPPLSAAESDAIAWGAVSRWAARPPGLDPADDGLGPSQPLSVLDAERLAASALRVHARKQHSLMQPRVLRAAAAALCVCGAVGVSFAAYRLWPAAIDASAPLASVQIHTPLPAAQPTAQAAERSTRVEPAPSLELKPSATVDPEELLARANALRAKRRWVAAETTYRQVIAPAASEQQRYVALVAAASISLQHLNKAARALSQYRSALALIPNGTLSEEALYGSAECYRALANAAAERKALDQLIAEYPTGLLTESAKRRIAELEAAAAER